MSEKERGERATRLKRAAAAAAAASPPPGRGEGRREGAGAEGRRDGEEGAGRGAPWDRGGPALARAGGWRALLEAALPAVPGTLGGVRSGPPGSAKGARGLPLRDGWRAKEDTHWRPPALLGDPLQGGDPTHVRVPCRPLTKETSAKPLEWRGVLRGV